MTEGCFSCLRFAVSSVVGHVSVPPYRCVQKGFLSFWMGVSAVGFVPDSRVRPALTGFCVTVRGVCSVTTVPASPVTQESVSVSAKANFVIGDLCFLFMNDHEYCMQCK